jgi:hypothetical protein
LHERGGRHDTRAAAQGSAADLAGAGAPSLEVEEGDYLEAEIVKDGVLLRPVTIAHRRDAWKSMMKAASSVRDTVPKGKRNESNDEAAIVREIKAHRRKHA